VATFVLVHGAWHGGWCWQKVAPPLHAAGHDVLTPTLTGLGERAHLLTPAVDLDTHVQDILGVLQYEDLTDVILVGHSYAGMIVTAVAARTPEWLAGLVYLDAFVPDGEQSVMDMLPPPVADSFRRRAAAEGEGWQLPPPRLEGIGVSDPATLAWATPRLTPQPLTTFEQPVRQDRAAMSLPRAYIYCAAKPQPDSFTDIASRLRNADGWQYAELATGHDAPLTAPDELAALLGTVGSLVRNA
jgi:pimeloyl-ACP methyl ester carboxylesterase